MQASSSKNLAIKLGLYRPARWVVDNVVNRHRLLEARRRMQLLTTLVPANSLCFDVGANIGDYTATMLQAGMKVVAIDPQPSCLAELQARFRRVSRVTIVPKGVDENPGSATFYINKNHAVSSMIKGWEGEAESNLSIELTTLDSLIEQFGVPYFIKMDIEGHEASALRGLHHKVPLISLEYHLNETDCVSKLEAVSYLSQFGTVTLNMLPDGAPSLMWPEFLSVEDFRSAFLAEYETAKRSRLFAYGDIFLKTV